MNVLITGASKGIGRELVKVFTLNNVNKIYALSRSEEELEKLKDECSLLNNDVKVVIVPFDLNGLLKNKKIPVSINNHLDIVINNAGLLINKPFFKYTTNDIISMNTINLIVPSLLLQLLESYLGGESHTHIINIGSMGGYQGSIKFPGLSIYSATKAALASLTECLAMEWKDRNISVNCLALGAVQTEMLTNAFPGYEAPVSASEMAKFIAEFSMQGSNIINGKIIPVSLSTP